MNQTSLSPEKRPGSAAPTAQWTERLRDGSTVRMRALCRHDALLERDFLERLSPQARRFRFLGQVQPSLELAKHLTALDHLRDVAFVAIVTEDGQEHAVGISRYSTSPDGRTGECAVAVRDDWQGRGLGVALMRHLIGIARARGVRTLVSIDAAGNQAMRDLAGFLGFARRVDPEDATQVIHTLPL